MGGGRPKFVNYSQYSVRIYRSAQPKTSVTTEGGASQLPKQCCGSGMFIPDPVFTHPGSRISDTGSKIVMLKKKMWANFHRILELFTHVPRFSSRFGVIYMIIWFPRDLD
jgi:hypothetical protein